MSDKVLIILPVANGARTLANSLLSAKSQSWDCCYTVCVVDSRSTDATRSIADSIADYVLETTGERSGKINLAFSEFGDKFDFVFWLDADMIMTPTLVERLVSLSTHGYDALYTREVILGTTWTSRTRSFERHFFDGTPVDSFRWVRASVFRSIGMMDADSFSNAGGEEWDLDARIRPFYPFSCLVDTQSAKWNQQLLEVLHKFREVPSNFVGIYHDDGRMSIRDFLVKKWYYMDGLAEYRNSKNRDRKQHQRMLSPSYRLFVVYVEKGKWRRVLRHPLKMFSVLILRFLVASTYVLHSAVRPFTGSSDPYKLKKVAS